VRTNATSKKSDSQLRGFVAATDAFEPMKHVLSPTPTVHEYRKLLL